MPPISSPVMNARSWAGLLALSVLWGGSFFFIGIAVREWSPLMIVFTRVAVAALILLAVLLCRRPLPRLSPGILLTLLGMSVFNNIIPFMLVAWSQGHISSGLASIFNATTPLFTVALLHVATEEKADRLKMMGLLIGFVGVMVMLGPDPGALGTTALLPQIAVLLASISYACAGLWSRRIARQGIPPLMAASGQLLGSALLLAPLVAVIEQPWRMAAPSGATILAMLGLALFSTALAYILFFRILARVGATHLSLVTFLIPVSAILLGVSFLSEGLTWAQIAGMMLIGAGLALIDGRLFRRLGRSNAP